MKKVYAIALALLVAAACTKENDQVPSSAQPETAAKAAVQRAITINLGSTVDLSGTVPPTVCSGDLPGFALGDLLLSGTANHLGELIATESRLHHENCDLSFTTALLTTGVSGQIVASNGDKIFYNGDDVINVFNLLTGSDTLGTITGQWTIDGGTGRFVGATGTLELNGTVNFNTSTFTGTGTGIITY